MKLRIGMLPLVLASIAGLVLIATIPIITINFTTSRTVFSEMAGRLVVQSTWGLEQAVRRHLDAARYQADFIIDNVLSGAVSLDDPEKLAAFASGSLAGAPQITGLVIADAQGRALGIERGQFGQVEERWLDVRSDSLLAQLDAEMRRRTTPQWGPPIYGEHIHATVLNLRSPIWRADQYLGYIAIGISTKALSELALELSEGPQSQVFVLYGQGRILAHRFLVLQSGNLSASKPLLGTGEVIDPVVQNLDKTRAFAGFTPPSGISVGEVTVGGADYIVLKKPVLGYGETPLVIGAYSDASAIDAVLRTMYRAVLIGAGTLIGGLLTAIFLSRLITGPVRDTSQAAAAVAALDFERAQPLPASRVREVDDLAISFNAMLVGLKSFSRYVPLTLVKRLIRENRVGSGTEERDITVMFTDIAGFTNACEDLSPIEMAAFVNDHLTLVSRNIEREGGTIDKYIGDAVMAFWGAPEIIDNPPLRAVRAAAAIQAEIASDNKRRISRGLVPVRIRIGIHSGPLIVGDIGAPTRLNYTVIGDVANVTQRIEALGKEIDADAESIVLVSRVVKERADDAFQFAEIGSRSVRGRSRPVEIYRLAEGGPSHIPSVRPPGTP